MSVFDLLNSEHYIKNERVVRERVNTCFWCPFYVSATGQNDNDEIKKQHKIVFYNQLW